MVTRTTPYPGLCHLKLVTDVPAVYHILIVDLANPKVALKFTAESERWQTVSSFAIHAGLAAAVNGGTWRLFTQKSYGLAAGNGKIWSAAKPKYSIFGVSGNQQAFILSSRDQSNLPPDLKGAVSGTPLLVENSGIASGLKQLANGRDARTAVGVSREGRTVYIVTVDGRHPHSIGASFEELAQLFISLGASEALNLDGGNSVSLYIAREGGLVNRPARGWEREVVNHIGIAVTETKTTSPVNPCPIKEDALFIPTNQKSPPVVNRGMRGVLSGLRVLDLLFIGKQREWVVPVAAVFAALMVIGLPVWGLIYLIFRKRRYSISSIRRRR